MTRHAHVAGWGMYVPPKVLTNDDLSRRVDTSDEWIRSRTGIAERRIADDGESTSTMAVAAAREALTQADLSPTAVDAIIVATISGDFITPSTACLVQAGLGSDRAVAFDLAAGCTGFVYALEVARMGIVTGVWSTVVVIGAETLSRLTDWEDRNTCVLFGDGAGALVLVERREPGGLLSTVLGADGTGADLLHVPAGGSRAPACNATLQGRQHFIRMEGQAVFRFATRVMPEAVVEALEKAGLKTEDLDLVIPHQANIRILESARKRLDLPPEALFVNLERYGNTSAASIPIALCEAANEQLINDGSLLALVGFGAGLTWGAAILRWGVHLPAEEPSLWKKNWQRLLFWSARVRMVLRGLWYHIWRLVPGGKDEV